MSRKDPSLLIIFSFLPWWVSILTGACVYIALQYIFPSLTIENPLITTLIIAGQNAVWIFSLMFVLPAVSSLFKNRKRKQLIQR